MLVEREDGTGNHAQTGHTQPFPQDARDGINSPPDIEQGDEGSDHQLPSPRRQQVEREGKLLYRRPMGDAETDDCDPRKDGRQSAPTEKPQDHHQRWKEDVELFLDRKTPRVQKRLERSGRIEIPALQPEEDVRPEAGDGDKALRELLAVDR